MLITALLAATALSATQRGDALAAFVRHDLRSNLTPVDEVAWLDLDGDGRDEALVYLRDPSFCGSGGCTLLIATPTKSGFRRIGYVTIVRSPVSVLTSWSQGWRDIAVGVGGGGVPPSRVKLRFHGHSYAGNPTLNPATRISPSDSGRVIIPGPTG